MDSDGGPAFPLPFIFDQSRGVNGQYVDGEDAGVHTGLSMRDFFAAKAMQALVAAGGYDEWHRLTSDAYHIADAMLKARKPTTT